MLITNGSLVHRSGVQKGLKVLNGYGGEVWFKLDSATDEGRALVNNSGQSLYSGIENLILSTKLCPTKLQTCLVDFDRRGLSVGEKKAFLDLLKSITAKGCDLKGVMLYTIARDSLQSEANRLEKLSLELLNEFAQEIRCLGFDVGVSY